MSRTLRIVVADDDASLRELVTRWLEELGHRVTAVDDGWALVQACQASRPDLVVSDVQMPHLDGLTAAEVIHRNAGPIPTVFISGNWEPDQERRAATLGAARLTKPFLPLDLLTAVDAVVPSHPVRRVLVVDDDADTVDSLAMLFELLGCEVRTARDAKQAEAEANEFHPHLLLVDLGLPRVNGLEVVRRIRGAVGGRAVRIAAHTGWAHEAAREAARAAGCDEYPVKPVSMAVLRELVGASSDTATDPNRARKLKPMTGELFGRGRHSNSISSY
jgi:CheY-like chemotaxis protein